MEKELFDNLYRKFKQGKATVEEIQQLEPYKVDNAIIMAAGFGLRSMPLSRTVPKGLYVVRNEVLIERQIRQLKEAGICNIIVVVGYLKEKFYYLKEKFDVEIIENDDYYRYNNISSLYAAREYLKNSYICCSDNYFNKNVFEPYVYDSYYACLYAQGYANEHCVLETKGDYITKIQKGASDAWYTIGEAYFSRKFSETFLQLLLEEYDEPDTRRMIWDDFHIRHIDLLPLRLYKYDKETVQEFDTIEDVKEFEPNFLEFCDSELKKADEENEASSMPKHFERYDNVARYDSATTDQHTGRLHLNENTFGPSPKCLEVLKSITIQDLYEYDMSSSDFLLEGISKTFSIPQDDIFLHNGSAELIKSIFSICLEKNDYVLVSNPGWSYYASLAKEKFCNVVEYSIKRDDYTYYFDVKDLFEKAEKYRPKLIVITSPNNPAGCRIQPEILERLIKEYPETQVLLDEAYFGFYEEDIDIRRLVETYSNIIVSRTFSKYYALANLRIGFAFCNFRMKPIWKLDLPLFRENIIARKMALAALGDDYYYKQMMGSLSESATQFTDELNRIPGVRAYQTSSNFIPVFIDGADMNNLQQYLKDNGILIRLFNDNSDVLARIAVAEKKVMNKTGQLIKAFLENEK